MQDAWEHVLILTKGVLDDIWTVQALTLDSKNTAGMIWGELSDDKTRSEADWFSSCVGHYPT